MNVEQKSLLVDNAIAGYLEYRRIVELSRGSGRGGMSRTTYVGALMARGRSPFRLLFIIILVIVILGTNLRTATYLANFNRFLGLWSLLLLAYITTVTGLLGSWADMKYFGGILQKRSYTVDKVYHRAATYAVRLTNVYLLTAVSVLFLAAYFVSTILGARIVGIATTVGLFSFAILLLIWIPKQLIDYFFLFAALFGKDRMMASNSITLVKHNLEILEATTPPPTSKDLYLGLADSDLRHAEVLLEWINLTVTIAAIVISVIFTERLLSSYDRLYKATEITFKTFGAQVSALTQLPYADAISTGILLVLVLFAVNFLLGLISLLVRIVLRYYFEVYRPAYALRQAFMIYFDSAANVALPTRSGVDSNPAKP